MFIDILSAIVGVYLVRTCIVLLNKNIARNKAINRHKRQKQKKP